MLLELVFHDVADLATAQQVELEQGHVLLGQPPQVREFRRGDAQRLGECLDPGNGFARGHAVGQRQDQEAVDELMAEVGRRKSRGEFRGRHRRQGSDVGVDVEKHTPRRLHQSELRLAGRTGD